MGKKNMRTSIAKNVGRRAGQILRPAASVHTEAAMAAKGIALPEYQDAMWNYVKAQRDGNLLYIGDHVGQDENGVTQRGKVGEGGDYTTEEAKTLAGQAAKRLLST